MATVIVNHRVKDSASWKALFDTDSQRRQGAGLKELAVGEKAGDPGMVYLVWQVNDTSVIEKMMASLWGFFIFIIDLSEIITTFAA